MAERKKVDTGILMYILFFPVQASNDPSNDSLKIVFQSVVLKFIEVSFPAGSLRELTAV